MEGVHALLGQELLRLRLQRGFSLRKLAKQLGMTAHSGIVDYERGVRIPPPDLISTYVQVLQPDGNRLVQLYEAAVADRARQRVLNSIQPEFRLGAADLEWIARLHMEQIMALNGVVRALEELTSKLSAAIA